MGRPPKPTELKRRLGNPGKRALPAPATTLPAPTADIPSPPAALKRYGKAAWFRLWSVGRAWLSPTTDLDILTRLCQAHDEREELRREVRQYGHVVTIVAPEDDDGPRGRGRPKAVYDIKANPAVSMLRKLEELITRYEGLCGFTPSDRARLGMAEVQRVSKLDDLIARRAARREGAAN